MKRKKRVTDDDNDDDDDYKEEVTGWTQGQLRPVSSDLEIFENDIYSE